MSYAKKLEDQLEAVEEEIAKVIGIEWYAFTLTRDFTAEPEQITAFFQEQEKRFNLKEWESYQSRAYRIAKNLLLNVSYIRGSYSPAMAHPVFLDKEDNVLFYRCLALLYIFKWEPRRS